MLNDKQIDSIVNRVVDQIATKPIEKKASPKEEAPSITIPVPMNTLGCFATIDEAIRAAEIAYWEFKEVSVKRRKKIIKAIREICHEKSFPLNCQCLSNLYIH